MPSLICSRHAEWIWMIADVVQGPGMASYLTDFVCERADAGAVSMIQGCSCLHAWIGHEVRGMCLHAEHASWASCWLACEACMPVFQLALVV